MITGLTALLMGLAAAPQPDAGVVNDRMSIVGADTLSAVMVDYCREAAPASANVVDAAWRKWRSAAEVDAIRAALGPDAVARTEAATNAKRQSMRQSLDQLGAPDAVCAQLPATWTQAGFDMRGNYPKAYPVGQVAAASPPAVTARATETTPTAPLQKTGAGLQQSQIEAIVSSWYQGYKGITFTLFETSYLALKDGTARKGLPKVGPADFDVVADRAASPDLWGKWQKAGKAYTFRFPGDSGFKTPENAQVEQRVPAGLKLNDEYHSSSGHKVVGGGTSVTFHSLKLEGNGRFTRSTWGVSGATMGLGPTTVSAGVTWDEKGSVTTVAGEGASVKGGILKKNAASDADLQGTYRIDGYELIMTFDSGRRESHFFYVSDNKHMISIDDGSMIIKTP